jgi:hypothetical protein
MFLDCNYIQFHIHPENKLILSSFGKKAGAIKMKISPKPLLKG